MGQINGTNAKGKPFFVGVPNLGDEEKMYSFPWEERNSITEDGGLWLHLVGFHSLLLAIICDANSFKRN